MPMDKFYSCRAGQYPKLGACQHPDGMGHNGSHVYDGPQIRTWLYHLIDLVYKRPASNGCQ